MRPLHWSAFRIEGVLASTPANQLTSGKTLGDLVSFPIEELSDWIRYSSDAPLAGGEFDRPYEGGFTVKLLEKRHGKP